MLLVPKFISFVTKRSKIFKAVIFTSLFWLLINAFLFTMFFYKVGDENSAARSRNAKVDEENRFLHPKTKENARTPDSKDQVHLKDVDDDEINPPVIERPRAETTTEIPPHPPEGKQYQEDLENFGNLPKFHEVSPQDPFYTYDPKLLHKWKPVAVPEMKEENYPGALGRPVIVDDKEAKETWHINQFNLVASDKIPLNRSLKDIRPFACQQKVYKPHLPKTSIIIVFHNEAWSTLLRTVHSIIMRSPNELLEEIVLVDDFSEQEHLKAKLDEYVKTLPVPTFVIRMPKRAGLVGARLVGAKAAKGTVFTFLDAHCECNFGWLEPLLAVIAHNRRAVVTPVITIINARTFQLFTEQGGGKMHLLQIGVLDPDFSFNWKFPAPDDVKRHEKDPALPYLSPAMAGGLFSIDREFFYHLGTYDNEMEFWGGENIEMSLRIWRCGGSLWIHPCSYVGHVFRSDTPHKWPGGENVRSRSILKNTKRTIEVWGDEYKKVIYNFNIGYTHVDPGNLTERLEIKNRLQCKSFRWYFNNVYTDSAFAEGFSRAGEVRHVGQNLCIDTMNRGMGGEIGLYPCHGLGGTQAWLYTTKKRIRKEELCLMPKTTKEGSRIVTDPCRDEKSRQYWEFNETGKILRNLDTNFCLGVDVSDGNNKKVIVKSCENEIKFMWNMAESSNPEK